MNRAFKSADILLPSSKKKIDMKKWAVVACDQYTSEPLYWEGVSELVGDDYSTLGLILPEIYLESDGVDERIAAIRETMRRYIDEGVFDEYKNALVYTERVQSDNRIRKGLVGAIDLEEYDYLKGSTSQVRATEATVAERIPPRVKIRSGAPIESPHIMILIDDADMTVIEPLSEMNDKMKKLYDTELSMNSGSISGFLAQGETANGVFAALDRLSSQESFNAKYGLDNCPVLLFAMGDGNHSLATAKEYYERLKRENPGKDMSRHPARYALAEIVNLHSDALQFEAIHRIVTEVDVQKLVDGAIEALGLSKQKTAWPLGIAVNGKTEEYYIGKPSSNLSVGSLQNYLDGYIAENGGKIDYIHGKNVVEELSCSPQSVGFILPDMDKSELFPTVIKDGALPRKTFSMGHAADKRFYIECRRISED